MPLLVSDITPLVGSKLNDSAQVTYTDTVLLPHVKTAWEELKLELGITGSYVINEVSNVLTLTAGQTDLFTAGIQPSNLLEPIELLERVAGSTDLFFPMKQLQWEPEIVQTDSLRFWVYRKQHLITPGAIVNREIKIRYQYALLDITSPADTLGVNYCKLFMIYKTAAEAARFVGNNKTRGDDLDARATKFLFKLNGINVRTKQGIRTRRRPYRIRRTSRSF